VAADPPAATGDRARGAGIYTARCGGCHSLEENGPGPRHQGLFGRKAGSQPGFKYSPALGASGLTWNAELLDRWLADPNALVPGNAMVVRLANDPQDRADLIAFLTEAAR